MLNSFKSILSISIFVFAAINSVSTYADKYADTLQDFVSAAESELMINEAYAYAVFPVIAKGGFTLGAAYGKGKVFVGKRLVGDMTMSQVSFGFQFGGQTYSQLILLKDKRALKEFISGSFEFGAQATAVALTLGANAEASTRGQSTGHANLDNAEVSANYYKGMAVYTIAKGGLMYEASIAGQKFEYRGIGQIPDVEDLSIKKIE